ncbi:MAG TPA: hypothetical protein VJ830_07095 [Anaerolineales bacterium]|nr:hypothetical protein [Anaerolineales bacterium]
MDNTLLNRIGIILNVLAGFLIAPELIGVERINRFQVILETRINDNTQLLKDRTARYQHFYILDNVDYRFVLVHSLIVTLIAIGIIYSVLMRDFVLMGQFMILGFTLSFVYALLMIWEHIYPEASHEIRDIAPRFRGRDMLANGVDSVLLLLLAVILAITWMAASFIITIVVLLSSRRLYPAAVILILLLGLQKTIGFIVLRLQGDDRMQTLLISWGIALFIVGNLLQLIATF